MNISKYLMAVCILGLTTPAAAAANAAPYAGEQNRPVKSLSADDIAELRRGGGWGLAKAAELNGIPGPAHLLDLRSQLALTTDQISRISEIFKTMKDQAIPLGNLLIQRERHLENLFTEQTMTPAHLQSALKDIAETRMKLRYVHLETHLKTPKILTSDQITKYRHLRGYTGQNPCLTPAKAQPNAQQNAQGENHKVHHNRC